MGVSAAFTTLATGALLRSVSYANSSDSPSGVSRTLSFTVTDTTGRLLFGHRADERFAMCSTFKFVAAAAVLSAVDKGDLALDKRIPFGEADLLSYAPVTKKHVAESRLSLEELCAAAVRVSDNTAANLLLARQGGPQALTDWLRTLGDPATRLDRNEPALNDVPPGDERDTTTPEAMARTLQAVVLGKVLSAASRERLQVWMRSSRTGDQRLRAGMPPGWRIGEKTGTGPRGTSNDVGVLWPPGRAPVVLACYLTGSTADGARRDAALAAVGRSVAHWVAA